MIRRALILLLLWPALAGAETLYLDCGCANDGDGTTETCAAGAGQAGPWNEADSVVWAATDTAGELDAGDTLVAAGECHNRFVIGASGTSGELITLSAPDGVILDGTVTADGSYTFNSSSVHTTASAWQLVSGSTTVYKKGSGAEWYELYEDGARLTPVPLYSETEATVLATLESGQWTVRNASLDSLSKTIYYRASDDAAPAAHALRVNRRDLDGDRGMFSCNAKDYWRLTGDWTVRRWHVATTGDAGFDIIDCDGYDTGGVTITENNAGANVDGGANGVFSATVTLNFTDGLSIEGATATLSSFTVRGTYTYNGGEPRHNGQDFDWNGDGDGVGIGHDGGTINGIVLDGVVASFNGPRRQTLVSGELGTLNRGAGLYLGTSSSLTVTGLIVRYSTFEGNHRYAMFLGDEAAGWKVYSSQFIETYCNPTYSGNGAVFSQAASGTVTYLFASNVVADNNCNGGASFATSNASATWTVVDNILAFNKHITEGTWFGQLHLSSSSATRVERNNLVYDDVETELWRYGGTRYDDLGTWQSVTGGGQSTVVADPLFLRDTYRVAPASPAVRAGYCYLTTGCVYPDFRGYRGRVPPDIGAYQRN